MSTEGTQPEEAGASAATQRWERWRRWVNTPRGELIAVTAFYLVLTLTLFAGALFGPEDRILSVDGADATLQFVHWRAFGFEQLKAGHLALWNPHIFGGTQYFGGFQAALLYPPNWLYLCLPLPRAMNAGIALHFFLAGWFTYFWVRHRGLHALAAVLAGVLFMCSGPFFLHIFAGHLPNISTMVWGPLILLAIDGWCLRRTPGWLLLGAGALAMQIFAGHPQYVFYTGVAAALYCVPKLWISPRKVVTAAGLATIPLGGVLLSAVQLCEGMHAAGESLRSKGTSLHFASTFSFPPENLITLLVPNFFGNMVTQHYWGAWLEWEMCAFISVTGFVLAVYALFRARRAEVWTLTGLVVCLLIFALGGYTVVFRFLYFYAPGFNKFRGWSKFIYPATLFLVMLAAYGLDALLRAGKAPKAMIAALLAASAIFVATGVTAEWSAHVGSADSPHFWDAWMEADTVFGIYSVDGSATRAELVQDAAHFTGHSLLVCALTLFILGAVCLASRRWQRALLALPALALIEMLHFALPTLVSTDFGPERRDAVTDYLVAHPLGDDRLIDLSDPNTGMTTGEDDLWGYDPGITRRYAEFINATQGIAPALASQEVQFKVQPAIYASLLRCRYLFPYADRSTDTIRVRHLGDGFVAPHVMLVPEVQVIASPADALEAVLAPTFQPRDAVILESAPVPPPAEHPAPGKAAVAAETTDSLTIEADLPDAEVLVVTDAYSDGWKARSLLRPGEGSAQTRYDVMPADYCVRAIPLAAGHHRFLLEYRPAAFLIGAWISGISVLLYAAAIGCFFRWRRRSPGVAGEVA